MATELIINASLPETRIALIEEGEIQDLVIERASGRGIAGNIYKGRVTRVLPGMQAAFVDIGLEKAAFLYVDDVYVHAEVFAEEEGPAPENPFAEAGAGSEASVESAASVEEVAESTESVHEGMSAESEAPAEFEFDAESESDAESDSDIELINPDENTGEPEEMGPPPEGHEDKEDKEGSKGGDDQEEGGNDGGDPVAASSVGAAEPAQEGQRGGRGRHSGRGRHTGRGRHSGRGNRTRGRHHRGGGGSPQAREAASDREQQAVSDLPVHAQDEIREMGHVESDRSELGSPDTTQTPTITEGVESTARPELAGASGNNQRQAHRSHEHARRGFHQHRSRDRRIRPRSSMRPVRAVVNIQDLLKEGQEVIVQVAKDPIASKGARLTCHISLPGRHLVCMPTIDHVGVSRRIERDDERRRLRDIVERYRPKNLGFIVRTAAGGRNTERRVQQDIDYLTNLWSEIREKSATVSAPALVYEDLNPILRAIRDWVTEDIDKIIVDSKFHFNEIQRFVATFMPLLRQKVELYHGDLPVFDAYGISKEISRALERKVWLKSGGYIVIDQAEALVAIDVNTGRFVGKKNLEDTILKTNLEAVEEVAYQLRLRNCGGIIIIDLIDMEKEENRHRVYRALEEALKKDRSRPTILKISELGLVEMTRKRTRDTMVRTLCESCNYCEGKGFIKSKHTVAYETLRELERAVMDRDAHKVMIQAHPDVIDILAIDERETLDQIEKRFRKQVFLQAVYDYHPEQFEVTTDKSPEKAKPYVPEAQRERERERNHRGGRSRRGGGGGHSQHRRSEQKQETEEMENEETSTATERTRGSQGAEFSDSPQARPQNQPQPRSVSTDESGEPNFNRTDLTPESTLQVYDKSTQTEGGSRTASAAAGSASDEFESEEDRLAYLRAQATQDAAIARLRGGNSPAGNANGHHSGGGHHRGHHNRGAHGGGQHNRGGRNNHRGNRGRGGGGGGGRYSHYRSNSNRPMSQAYGRPSGGGMQSSSQAQGQGGGSAPETQAASSTPAASSSGGSSGESKE